MVAADTTNPQEKTLVEEIRKALGGPSEKLIDTLSSLRAWADEVLTAVIECVEKPQEMVEKKKKKEKEVKGSISLGHLLNEGFKKFLTEHVAQLGAEGAAKMMKELETRIEDEKKEKEETRIYCHLLVHFVAQGANVMGYERLRGTVKEALARMIDGLWKRGIRDASYTLARVVVYMLLAERDYIEGMEVDEAEMWWKKEVMEKEKKLRKNAFFAALTTLVEKNKEKEKDWSKVDLESAEEGDIKGAEGVLNERWILVDTVVCHAPSLAARCDATVYQELLRIVVRAHVERAKMASLISRLASMVDLPRDSWTVVIREAVLSIGRVFDGCTESRERLMFDGETVTMDEERAGMKHRVGCGCSAPVAQIIRGLAAVPKTSLDVATIDYLEQSLILVLSTMDTTEGEPLKEAISLLTYLAEQSESKNVKREWPEEGVQLLRSIKAMLTREKVGETHTALLVLSRTLLARYGHSAGYSSRLFLDVGHVASRVLIGETSTAELASMKPSGIAKTTDKLAKSLLKWARKVREEKEEEENEKEIELLSSWSSSLLSTTAAHGLSTVVLQTLVSMGRERREELLPNVWSEKERVKKMIDDCLSLLLASAPNDETYERNADDHKTEIVSGTAAAIDARLARAACLFLLNCTPYLARKVSPADLATWERLRAMEANCASLVLERVKPDAIQSLFSALPALIDSFTPPPTPFQQLLEAEVEEEDKAEEGGEKKAKKRRRGEGPTDPVKTASLQQLTRVARLAAAALSERAAVPQETAAAALAAAAGCITVASDGAAKAAAEGAAAAFYEMATKCLEVYGEAASHSGMLAIALATAATRRPPSTDYDKSRAELLQHARLLAAAARHCKQGLLKDQVSIYSQLLARVLQSAAAHSEKQQGWKSAEEDDSGPSGMKRRRDCQRTLHSTAKAANAINDEAHFSKVMPFVLADCLLPLRTAPPSIQYPAVLLSQAVDRYGRSFLATCLPPAQRLAYTRMFPTFKEMNRKVV